MNRRRRRDAVPFHAVLVPSDIVWLITCANLKQTHQEAIGQRAEELFRAAVDRAFSDKIDIGMVAARAGVSVATVSPAINPAPTVDPVLVERVWRGL
jgi:hypothetical protein